MRVHPPEVDAAIVAHVPDAATRSVGHARTSSVVYLITIWPQVSMFSLLAPAAVQRVHVQFVYGTFIHSSVWKGAAAYRSARTPRGW